MSERECPSCGLSMPLRDGSTHVYYNASPECWSVYTEVLAAEYGNAVLFGQVHQLTVDAYAVQHAGGSHPDKSVDVHLLGLHFVLDEGVAPAAVPPMLQRIATDVREWPHFAAPPRVSEVTVLDVALASDPVAHAEAVRRWASTVWRAWSARHASVARLAKLA